jgi:flagellar hook-basal body complex protein FliE
MFPVSNISAASSIYDLTPQARVARTGISPLETPEIQSPLPGSETQAPSDTFANMLGRMVNDVNAKQNVAADAVSALQSGQNVSLHQAVIAMEEANISFQLMVEVRNKLLESYQEIMRMQV